MKQDLNYALVTGASSGIGWDIATELAKKGYSIIAVSNQPEALQKLKDELESNLSVHVQVMHVDLESPTAANEVFATCEEFQWEVDVLVNNAGILIIDEAVEVEVKRSATLLQLHMITPALLCQLFGAKMKAKCKGYILNVSSISAVMPFPIISLYGPSKAFLRSFSRALRTELQPYGVSVTCALPGATATSLYDNHSVNVPRALKLGIMKRPEQVARSAVRAMLSNKPECTPGWINKVIVFVVPLIPHFAITWINQRRLKKAQTSSV